MIWHVSEVFLVLAVTFACGCFLGAVVHAHFAAGRHRTRQEAFADGLGRVVEAGARGMRAAAGSALERSATMLKARQPTEPPAEVPQFKGPLKTHEEHKAELEHVLASLKGWAAASNETVQDGKTEVPPANDEESLPPSRR